MEKIFITVTGLNHYYGASFFKEGMELTLEKEGQNIFDHEAIKVQFSPFGTIGHVANSTNTVIGECYSAGRIYDRFDKIAKAKVVYVLEGRFALVCEFIE